MKIKIKKVYYCDYCKKHYLLPCHEHEKYCTANPNRKCRLCENQFSIDLSKLVKRYKESYKIKRSGDTIKIKWRDNTEIKLEDVMDSAEGCPVCAFTIIRLAGLNKFPINITIELEKEIEKYWQEQEWWDEKSSYQ